MLELHLKMPKISRTDIDNGCRTDEFMEKQKYVSDQKDNENYFRAKIIPYDTSGDPNAPVLAFSGDTMNLIFNIPKESFRKLAIAVVDHLGDDPGFKPPESSEEAAGDNKSLSNKQKGSEISSKSSLNDALHDLDGNNTKDIIDAYVEDSNDFPSCKNMAASRNDLKLYKDSSPLNEPKFSNHNNGTELREETVSNDSETGELKQCKQTALGFEASSNISKDFTDSDSDSSSKTLIKSSPDKEYNEENLDIGVCENGNTEQGAVDQQTSVATCNEDASEEMNLSAHNLDICDGDCPELKTAWPEIQPFKETEEIPLTELKSMSLNGVFTKYLKLELSNEFIVIKVTSDSDVLVHAAKYKETMNDLSSKSVKESKSFIREVSAKSYSLNITSNTDEISMSETNALEQDEITDCKQNKDKPSDISELLTKESMDSVHQSPVRDDIQYLDPQISLNIQSKELNETALNEISSILATEAKTSKSLGLESSLDDSSDLPDDTSEREAFEHNPIKYFENDFQKMISLKIEEKLDEMDTDIFGSSPTERLKFSLRDCLKKSFNESDTEEQAEKYTTDTSEKLLKESNAEVNSSESSIECDSRSREKHLKMDTPENAPIAAISKSCDSIEVTKPVSTENNLSLESENNLSLTTENELLNISKGASSSSGNESIDSPDYESGDVNKDATAFEKSIGSNQTENSQISSEETNIDLNVSKNEVLKNVASQLEINEDDSPDDGNPERISCRLHEKTNSTNGKEEFESGVDNYNRDSENTQEHVQNKVEENNCQRETVIKDTELERSEKVLENPIRDRKLQLSTLIDYGNTDKIVSDAALEISTEEINNQEETSGKKGAKDETRDLDETISADDFKTSERDAENTYSPNIVEKGSSVMKEIKKEEMNDNSEYFVTDASVEVLIETVDPLEPESSISPEKTFTEQSSACIDDSIADANDTIDELPENSFASNIDSFMDTTVEACSESMSEGGDLESDDVKSIASESDDSKDSDKQAATLKGLKKSKYKVDEVDCAPTRNRTRKAICGLSKNVIPENSEVKNGTTCSKNYGSTLNVLSKHSGKTSPIGRSLRSKSLDPAPQPTKVMDKKRSFIESEEATRRTRAKTPDIISKKDLKTTLRSSPRKLTRSNAAAETSSTSKIASAKSTLADAVPKSRANLDSSVSTSKRSKQSSKD